MNELEFRKRVYANPGAIDQELLAAASTDPACQKILDETLELEANVLTLVRSVSAPDGMVNRLLAIASSDASNTNKREVNKPWSFNFFNYRYAMAASMLLALGIGAMVLMDRAPVSPKVAFHSAAFEHLYMEMGEISAINSGSQLTAIPLPAVVDVMAKANTRFNDEGVMQSTPVYFAKPCVILPTALSAHLMIAGTQGAVSVFVINNSPVNAEYSIQDDRFRGVVVPMADGNLILIGEQNEDLQSIKSMFEQNVTWAI